MIKDLWPLGLSLGLLVAWVVPGIVERIRAAPDLQRPPGEE